MKIIDRGTIFPSLPATDRQSCAFPQVTADAPFHRIALLPELVEKYGKY
jgi:hypothetical protein